MSYNKIQDNFWIDNRVRSWDFKTRMIALYLLSNQHCISEGLYRLPLSYIVEDMQLDKKEILKAINKLISDQFIKYDRENSMVLISKALKYHPLQNINHCKAALNKLEALPESPLLSDLLKKAAEYNPKLYKFLKEKSKKKNFLKLAFNRIKDIKSTENNGIKIEERNSIKTKNNDSQALTQALNQTQAQTQAQSKTKVVDNSEIIFSENSFDDHNFDQKAKLCCYLIDLISKNNARASVPKKNPADPLFKKWVQEIDKLYRLGPVGAAKSENKSYSFKEIKEIISFSQQDQFWKNNILSAKKLRKQIVKLENKMKSSKSYNSTKKTNKLKKLYLAAKEDELNEKE